MTTNNNRSLSVRRVLRAIATPVCECGKCGKLEQQNPISAMKKVGLVIEIDEEKTRIEMNAYTIKELREKIKTIDSIDNITGGQGPFFTKEGKPPLIRHVGTIDTSEALKIMAEAVGAEVTIIERGFQIAMTM